MPPRSMCILSCGWLCKNDLKTKRIKGVRYTDKRDYNTITTKENLSEENKTFYMNVLKEIDNVNNGTSTISICKKEEK